MIEGIENWTIELLGGRAMRRENMMGWMCSCVCYLDYLGREKVDHEIVDGMILTLAAAAAVGFTLEHVGRAQN